MEKLKEWKVDITVSAVLSVVVGLLLIFCPGTIVTVLARVIAMLLIVLGVVLLIPRLLEPIKRYASIVVAVLVTLIGVWMFCQPKLIASIIPIAIGVILVVHGLQDIAMAVEGKQKNANNWWSIPVMGILNMVLGVLCICNAFGIVKIGLILIGLMMVYDGLTDMFIVHKVNKATKDVVDATLTKEETVDDYQDYV